jgi:hypothetical protein
MCSSDENDRVDDPQRGSVGYDGESDRRQRREEHAVGIGWTHRPGRDDRNLAAGRDHARIEEEALAGEAHRPRDQVLDVGLGLQRDQDRPCVVLALVQRLVIGRALTSRRFVVGGCRICGDPAIAGKQRGGKQRHKDDHRDRASHVAALIKRRASG